MFARIFAEIRRLHWGWQLVLIPVFFVVSTPLKMIGWALTEMFGSAKAKAKKTFAPMLWPAVGIVAFIFLFAALGERQMVGMVQQLMPAAILIAAMYFFFIVAPKIMFRGLGSSKKKKKK